MVIDSTSRALGDQPSALSQDGALERREANARAVERAGHLDRYVDTQRQAAGALDDLSIGQHFDGRALALMEHSLDLLGGLRAAMRSTEAYHLVAVIMDSLGRAIALERLEDTHVYQTAAPRQVQILEIARQGAAACEAGR